MASTIQITVNKKSKSKTAEDNPFTPMNEKDILTKLENSRAHANRGKYKIADDMVSDLRKKYDL